MFIGQGAVRDRETVQWDIVVNYGLDCTAAAGGWHIFKTA